MNIYGYLASGAAILVAGGLIFFQHQEIGTLKDNKTLLEKSIKDLESKVQSLGLEKASVDKAIEEYKNRKSEIVVKYINRPVIKFVELIKTETPEVVTTKAKEGLNEVYNNITSHAIDFSLSKPSN